jgi:hypothetical protein
MFRVVIPPIIRSACNCIYSIWYLSHRYCYLSLSWKSWNPKHVEQFPDINKLCNVASCRMYEYIGILLGARPILHISRIKVKDGRYTFIFAFQLILIQKMWRFAVAFAPYVSICIVCSIQHYFLFNGIDACIGHTCNTARLTRYCNNMRLNG